VGVILEAVKPAALSAVHVQPGQGKGTAVKHKYQLSVAGNTEVNYTLTGSLCGGLALGQSWLAHRQEHFAAAAQSAAEAALKARSVLKVLQCFQRLAPAVTSSV
jgi:hypothetical protein